MEKLSETEEKILDAALAMVSEGGSFNITIRDLAKRADVNVGAINYHFKTKDNMLELVKQYYIDNTITAYGPIKDDSLTDLEKVKVFSKEIINYTLKYPGVVNLLKEIYKYREEDEGFERIASITNELNESLDSVLRNVFGGKDELKYQFKKNIFLSSIVYPVTHMEIMLLDKSVMYDEDKKIEYIDYILSLLI